MFAYTYSLFNIPRKLVRVRVSTLVASHVPVGVHVQMRNFFMQIYIYYSNKYEPTSMLINE